MGDINIFYFILFIFLLGYFLYFIFANLAISVSWIFKFFSKRYFFDFYECGCKPRVQKNIIISINFFLLMVFFVLYDVDLLLCLPFGVNLLFGGFSDFVCLFIFFLSLVTSIVFDVVYNAFGWKFN